MKSHRIFPEPRTGYELNPKRGFFGVIIPKQATNICACPSFEGNRIGDWASYNSSIDSLHGFELGGYGAARRGAYCLRIRNPTGGRWGAQYDFGAALDTGIWSAGLDLLGQPGVEYWLEWADAGGNLLVRSKVVANGFWQRAQLKGTHTNTFQIFRITAPETATRRFFIDGVLIESGLPSTYFDGDSLGFIPTRKDFRWNGDPHDSTSWRSGNARAGGRLILFDDTDFHVLGYTGLGTMPIEHITFPRPLVGGDNYQRTLPQTRQYNIVGSFSEKDFLNLMGEESELISYIGPQNVAGQQPVLIFYQAYDCNEEISRRALLPSLYVGGLEGNANNLYQERATISFNKPSPEIDEDGDEGGQLDHLDDVGGSGYILMRDGETGEWNDMDTGADDVVRAIAEVPADGDYGRIYVGGDFLIVGGGAGIGANRIAKYDRENETWENLGPAFGVNDLVRTILPGLNPDNVYIGGDFTDVAGGPGGTHNRITRYSISGDSFNALGGGLASDCRDLAWGIDGTLYAVGPFGLEAWDGTAWNNIGTVSGGSDTVWAVAVDTNGDVYIGGGFNTVNPGAVSAQRVAKWDGSSWSQVGPGLTPIVRDMFFGDDGLLYLSGGFDSDGDGNVVERVCTWNGTRYQQLGNTGDVALSYPVYSMAMSLGKLYAGGPGFQNVGGISDADWIAVWNGVAWGCVDIVFDDAGWAASTDGPQVVYTDSRNNLFVGLNQNPSNHRVSGDNQIHSTATVYAEPIITLEAEAGTEDQRILTLRNVTTGHEIWFNGLNIIHNEIITIDFRKNSKRIISSIRGDLTYTLVPGSDFDNFIIQPGDNYISLLCPWTEEEGATGPLAYIHWGIKHLSVNNLSYKAPGNTIETVS